MSDIELELPNNALMGLVVTNEPRNNQPEDIPDVDPEELARAIAICDATPLPEPIVPPTQQTNSPSWD